MAINAASVVSGDFWSPEVLLTGIGLVLALVLWVVDRLWVRRSRITYRVHLDTPMRPQDADLFDVDVSWRGQQVIDASLALIRIRNQGSGDVAAEDFSSPLKLMFPGRRVLSVVVPAADPAVLKDVLTESSVQVAGDSVTLPPISLNRGDSFKVLALLTGQGSGVSAQAFIKGGSLTHDAGRIAPSYRTLAFAAVVLLFAGTLAGLLVSSVRGSPELCRDGDLLVTGSTAFEPIMTRIADAYERECPGADISVAADGSLEGTQNLVADVQADRSLRASRLAMSDVVAEYPDLVGRQVGTLVFTFVVNRSSGVTALSMTQIRDIYAGRYRTWREVDPAAADVPIVLISRDARSGTRQVVERKILLGIEGPVTSDDCVTPKPLPDGDDLPLRCEKRETSQVLTEVNGNPGAIGYAQPADVADFDSVQPIELDGAPPTIQAVRDGRYPFWSSEQVYTFGPPQEGSLVKAFLEYVTGTYLQTPQAEQDLIDNGFEPLAGG